MVINMAPKDTRNLIIALVMLALGVKLLLYVSAHFVDISAAGDIGKSFNDMGDLFVYGAILLAAILVPFYLSAKNNEKKKEGM